MLILRMCSVCHDKLTLRHNATTHILDNIHNAEQKRKKVDIQNTHNDIRRLAKENLRD